MQSSVVHLQGVSLSQRFALVPLGPPLLTYSPTAKALLKYDAASKQVVLAVDRAYSAGDPIVAWCGPQPNSRLLINYGAPFRQPRTEMSPAPAANLSISGPTFVS